MHLLLIDTGNLYYCVTRRFERKRIDYQKYIDFVAPTKMVAYVAESNNDVEGFKSYLEELGFDVTSKRPQRKKVKGEIVYSTNWSVEMSLTIADNRTGLDKVTIGSSDVDLLPLLYWLQQQELPCNVVASGIPRTFKTLAECTEIEESILI
jgi:hypothetical protein